jgi:hypothetical protein
MECLAVPKIPNGSEWVYEIKLDGYRALGRRTVTGSLIRTSASTPRENLRLDLSSSETEDSGSKKLGKLGAR